ncbi:MAG: NAD(P)/FAD-dependent oxidoreductase [Balneolaceae bacterium]|nr:NAD(P)/FAD-dependent oxidoreductase [Balneolaceae bacterium]MCH8548605.1 NAD(P)/FAD-dependent oxidoreductase [Balneolaceae bacterium]
MSRSSNTFDAIVVGTGPNGLAAAIRLAQEGLSVMVYEAASTPGGGMRTKELMQSGVRHDICSAIHPMGASSPYMKKLPLDQFGLEWIHPPVAAAHPFDDESAALLTPDLFETAFQLGEDEKIYRDIVSPIVQNWDHLTRDFLGPLSIPRHPLKLASFGLKGLQPSTLFKRHFKTERAKGLLAGMAAHAILPLSSIATTAIGLVFFGAAHTNGWPIAKGGSQSIADAMVAYAESLGVRFEYSRPVRDINQLPPSTAVLFDLTPIQVANIAGSRLPGAYLNRLKRFRYGQGVFKIDYVLKEPVPWLDKNCLKSGTVHLGGTFSEIAESEKSMDSGTHPEKPFVLVAQQSLFDESRTPDDRHTLWAYCHVPSSSERDMTGAIEDQIERFAPGFRDVIEEKHTMNCFDFQKYNMNYIGGDINGGRQDITQLFSRPVSLFNPYDMPADGLYFCSSSTPPGGGVHGMCGYHAATRALKKEFGLRSSDFSFRL